MKRRGACLIPTSFYDPENVSVPLNISGDRIDPRIIDSKIRNTFRLRREDEIPKLRERISFLQDKMSQPMSVVEQADITRHIEEAKSKMIRLVQDIDLEEYSAKAVEIFNLLAQCVSDASRNPLLHKYVDMAREYIDINMTMQSGSDRCPDCNLTLADMFTLPNGNKCCDCGIEKVVYSRKDGEETTGGEGGGKTNNYQDRETFEKKMKIWQGIIHPEIDNNILITLDEYLTLRNLPGIEEAKKLPLVRWKKEGTSSSMLKDALKKNGFGKWEVNINYIAHRLWGWTLPDLSPWRDQIMKDYAKTQEIFNSFRRHKQSTINTNFRLFKHLQLVGFECDEEDFKIPVTPKTLEACKRNWKKMVEGAGLEYIA